MASSYKLFSYNSPLKRYVPERRWKSIFPTIAQGGGLRPSSLAVERNNQTLKILSNPTRKNVEVLNQVNVVTPSICQEKYCQKISGHQTKGRKVSVLLEPHWLVGNIIILLVA